MVSARGRHRGFQFDHLHGVRWQWIPELARPERGMSGMPRHRRGAQEHPRSRVEEKEGVSTMPAIRVSRGVDQKRRAHQPPLEVAEVGLEQPRLLPFRRVPSPASRPAVLLVVVRPSGARLAWCRHRTTFFCVERGSISPLRLPTHFNSLRSRYHPRMLVILSVFLLKTMSLLKLTKNQSDPVPPMTRSPRASS